MSEPLAFSCYYASYLDRPVALLLACKCTEGHCRSGIPVKGSHSLIIAFPCILCMSPHLALLLHHNASHSPSQCVPPHLNKQHPWPPLVLMAVVAANSVTAAVSCVPMGSKLASRDSGKPLDQPAQPRLLYHLCLRVHHGLSGQPQTHPRKHPDLASCCSRHKHVPADAT
jgi:hypothetical protein